MKANIDSRLEIYIDELLKWNKKINLIGRKTEPEVREQHIDNSLELVPYIKSSGQNVWVDIGSGGGLPAIPLSICFPDKRFILTDLIGKKIRFLEWIISKLQLNAEVVNSESGRHLVYKKSCGITSRAYGKMAEILKWSSAHTPGAREFLLLKGKIENTEEELKSAGIDNYRIEPLNRGCLVMIKR